MKEAKITMKGDTAEVLLYDVIGSDFFGEGITAKTFREQVRAIKSPIINLRINSPGGNVFEAASMFTALDQHKARIEVDVDGLAASAASLIAMAGDEVRIASNAMFMIHNPHGIAMGDGAEMRRTAELLDKARGQYVDTYMKKATVGREQVEAWMDEETWFTGQEAVAVGFADSVGGEMKVAACANLKTLAEKLHFKKMPAALTAPPPKDESAWRETEQRRALLASIGLK